MTPVVYLVLTIATQGALPNVTPMVGSQTIAYATMQACENAGAQIVNSLARSKLSRFVMVNYSCTEGGVK